MRIQRDTVGQPGQPFIEWEQAPGCFKRAWIARRTGDKDWAKARDGRYLMVVRKEPGREGSGGAPTDFPIFSDLPDEQILVGFVAAVNGITGCRFPPD